jgi:hypothetical protein
MLTGFVSGEEEHRRIEMMNRVTGSAKRGDRRVLQSALGFGEIVAGARKND